MILRIISGLILLASAVYFPIYITGIIVAFCLYKFEKYYEVIFIFFIHDVLYGVPEPRYFGFRYVMTLIAIISVVVIEKVRKQIFSGNMRLS